MESRTIDGSLHITLPEAIKDEVEVVPHLNVAGKLVAALLHFSRHSGVPR